MDSAGWAFETSYRSYNNSSRQGGVWRVMTNADNTTAYVVARRWIIRYKNHDNGDGNTARTSHTCPVFRRAGGEGLMARSRIWQRKSHRTESWSKVSISASKKMRPHV